MNLQIFHVDGVPFVVSPYQIGMHIRQDVFHRQLFVSCLGEIEYPEDVAIYGTYRIDGGLDLGRCGLIEEAMVFAQSRVDADNFDLGDDSEALSFSVELIQIHDERGRLVLTGRVPGRTVDWSMPVSSKTEANEVHKEIDELHGEISEAMRADNYSTMRYLRKKIRALEGRFVHTRWRHHAILAVSTFMS